MLRLILFAAFVAMPIAEIAVFLVVGGAIGVLPTIAIIIVTALLGTILLRSQGLSALQRLRSDLDNKRVPAAAIGHAVTVAIAGVLLLTPGFITDSIGFALFVPGVRRGLWKLIASNVKIETVASGGQRNRTHRSGGGGRTIDLDSDDYGPADPGHR